MQLPPFGRSAAIAILLVISAADAVADDIGRTAAESITLAGSDSSSARSKANDWMIMPGGTLTLGGSIQFMTAEAGLGDRLRFTDVVLLSLHARRSFYDRFELFTDATFLPKQPSFTDELIWQNATAGARIGAGKRYAGAMILSGGPLLGDRGYWGGGVLGLHARKSLHDTLVVEGGVGGAMTSLFDDHRSRTPWLAEVSASAELVFREPSGMTAGWIGTEFRFPVAHDSQTSDLGEEPFDPQTRVNVHLGIVLSYIKNWDIYAKYVVVDRGDYVDPTTTLPILEGGFDQRHFIIGLTHRFPPKPKQPRYPDMIAE